MAQTGDRDDPYAGFNFILEIENTDAAGFAECSGLTTETDIIEYREGSETQTVRKLPGLRKYTNIVLKRGFTANKDLWDWRKTVIDGKTERRSGSIVLQDESKAEALRWNFAAAWPSKWEGPAFNAKNSEVAIETLELCIEDLVLA